jgi:hypothetical protein
MMGNDQVLDWLLESENPSVRYWTLVDLLGRPNEDPEVLAAQRDIMHSAPVTLILARQNPGGWWGKAEDFYIHAKYKGTVWNLILLAELGAGLAGTGCWRDPADERIRRALSFILETSQDAASAGFSARTKYGEGADRSLVIPCLTGNMLWCLVRFGWLEDPRVQQGLSCITTYQRFDDGIKNAPQGWPYSVSDKCWGRHTCHLGVVKALKALSEVPPDRRTPPMQATIENGAEFLLRHHIYRKSHDLSQVAMPEWLSLGFPRFWDSDILEILGILTRLGYRDERMNEALEILSAKQDGEGHWGLESSWNGRMLVRVEKEGEPSKWITLKALCCLKPYPSG